MSARKIIDPKQNGEKVWLKGHAQAIYMSDGSTVEDAINSIEIPSLDEYVTETELNDKGFLTEHQDISHLASRNWVESQGYAHQEDLLEISFNDIQDSPISIDDSGMINFVDESGNVGFQINEEGLRVTDVIAGEHKLSEKANVSDIPSLDGYAKTEDIPSVDGLVKSEDLPNFDEFAKTEDIPSLDGYAKTSEIPSLDGYASKEWVNNRNYATEYDLKTIDYSTINNVPVSEDETGELNIADESGNIGMKVASEAVYAKDFVAGEHKLSEKQDELVSGTNIKTINGISILGEGDITISGGSGSSNANVQAVDTGDVIDDVNVDYATKTYVDGLVGDINSVLESIISGGTNALQENLILYGNLTRAAEYNYFYSLYPVESDITITADWYHPINGEQTLVCHISKGNTKIDETLTMAYEFTNVVITPESDSKYIYTYNS